MQGLVIYLLILLGVAAVLRVYPYFSVIYLLMLIYLISRLWARRSLTRLQATRRFVDRAFFGDQVDVHLTIHNASLLPVTWVALREFLPGALTPITTVRQVASLEANERWQVTYSLECRKRGVYSIGPMELETGDLLGAQPPRRKEIEPQRLIVYPKVVPLSALGLPTRAPLAALKTPIPIFEDPARVTGVREYQQGDSPRRIHWTATASAGRLLVKQFQPAIARDMHIVVNMRPEDYEDRHTFRAIEMAITTAASLANHVIGREGLAAGLTVEGWDTVQADWRRFSLLPRAERAQLMALLEVLARVQTSPTAQHDPLALRKKAPTMSFPDILRSESLTLGWGTTLAILTGRETLPLLESVVYLQKMGFAVALILITPERRRQSSVPRGVSVYRVWEEADLEAEL